MSRMDEIRENVVIDSWARHFTAGAYKVNKPHETDAEILEVQTCPDHYLALTVDTVAEEIAEGLYRDPFTMGWVTVMASLSDLAAVGAEPLGLAVSASVDTGRDESFIDAAAEGMERACKAAGTSIIGGDVNTTPDVAFTGCALGLVPKGELMTRRGCRPGDSVYITGRVGTGNALGLVRLSGMPDELFPEQSYRPQARTREARLLRRYAGCCMDTSDGLLATLDQLMRLNRVGFEIRGRWSDLVDPRVLEVCAQAKVPAWLTAAGPHGEFELVLTVSAEQEPEMLRNVSENDMTLVKVGLVHERADIHVRLKSGEEVILDVARMRNLLDEVEGDARRYLTEFLALGKEYGLD
ncbi:MAG: thiamine-monophosphate kinase [candidate division WOR-3 bacterium]|nr:MAG: thiamine-monophosphate kinase [candidate division WOR-3 bacterium]